MQQPLTFKAVGPLRRLMSWPALRHIPLSDAMCGGIVCTAPAVLAAYLHDPLFSWSAIAAFWTCLAIPVGTFGRRCLYALIFGFAGALASGLGAWVAAYPLLTIGLVAFVSFGGAFAQAGGLEVSLPALLVATAFAVSTAFPGKDFVHGLTYSCYFLYGNLWAGGCALLLWGNRTYRPASRALASSLYELSNLARGLASLDERAISRARSKIRLHLDDAQQQIHTLANHNSRTHRLVQLLSTAQDLFRLLIGLEELTRYERDSVLPSESEAISAHVLTQIAEAIQSLTASWGCREDLEERLQGLDKVTGRLRTLRKNAVGPGFKTNALCDLTENIRCTLAQGYKLAHKAQGNLPGHFPTAKASSGPSVWYALKTNFTPQSHFFLHGIRVAIASAISAGLVQAWSLDHGYWLTLTVLLIMQPQFSGTLKTSVERVVGTLLGGALAATLGFFIHCPLLLSVLVLPISFGTLATRSINYLAYVLFLTPHFILVAQLGQPNGSELDLACLRILNSFGGALLAIGITFLLCPRGEGRRLSATLASAMDATAAYLCSGVTGNQPTSDARGYACVAIDQIEKSVQSTGYEPKGDREKIIGAVELAGALRNVVGTTTLLVVSSQNAWAPSDVERLKMFAQWATREMKRSAALLRGVPLNDAEVGSTIVNTGPTSELLSHILERLTMSLALIRRTAECTKWR